MRKPTYVLTMSRAVRRSAHTNVQAVLALASIATLFLPTRSYAVLFTFGDAEFRIQDLLFGCFVVSLVIAPSELRAATRKAASNYATFAAVAFFALALISVRRVPTSELAESLTAVGKLIEFSVIGLLAGITIVNTGVFLHLAAVIGIGAAINAAISVGRATVESGPEGLLFQRPDGFLGPDVLATGGAVAALAGLALMRSRGRRRALAIAVFALGAFAMFAGKSVLATFAFFVGVLVTSFLIKRPSQRVALALPVLVLIAVLAARQADLVKVRRILDSPSSVDQRTEPFSRNLIRNGGFEFGPEGWYANGGALRTRVNAQHRFGGAACEIITTGRRTSEGIFHDLIPTNGISVYSLSAWIKAADGIEIAIGLEWYLNGRFLSARHMLAKGAGRWRRTSFEGVRAPPRVTAVRPTMYVIGVNRSVRFYVDGVQLEQGSGATAYGDRAKEPTQNILSNGGFEDGISQWNRNGDGLQTNRVSRGRFGSSALRIAVSNGAGGEGIFHTPIPIQVKARYSLSAWVRATQPATNLRLGVEWLNSRQRLLGARTTGVRATARWRRVILRDIEAPTGAASARPTVYTVRGAPAATFYLDGVQLERRRIPTPYHRAFGEAGAPSAALESEYAGGSFVHRILLMYIGTQIVLDHPFTGVGWLEARRPKYIGSPKYEQAARKLFPNVDPRLYPSELPTHTHNAYLETAADAGIPTLVAFLAALGIALWGAVRSASHLRGNERVYAGIAASILVAVAVWLNSNPLFGGSLEVGLLWCAAGMSLAFESRLSDGSRSDPLRQSQPNAH